jgi:hypothetical protein
MWSFFFVWAIPEKKQKQLRRQREISLYEIRIRQFDKLILEGSDYPINFLLIAECIKFLFKYLPYDNPSIND